MTLKSRVTKNQNIIPAEHKTSRRENVLPLHAFSHHRSPAGGIAPNLPFTPNLVHDAEGGGITRALTGLGAHGINLLWLEVHSNENRLLPIVIPQVTPQMLPSAPPQREP